MVTFCLKSFTIGIGRHAEQQYDQQCRCWPNRLSSWKGITAHLQAPHDTSMVSTITTHTSLPQRDSARPSSAPGGRRQGMLDRGTRGAAIRSAMQAIHQQMRERWHHRWTRCQAAKHRFPYRSCHQRNNQLHHATSPRRLSLRRHATCVAQHVGMAVPHVSHDIRSCSSAGSTVRHDAKLTADSLSHAGNAETE